MVVAGGAGTIGSALVSGFADAGASVGVIDLDVSNLDARVRARERTDVSDADAARGSLHSIIEQLGGLDGLVHCVGINDRKPIESYIASEWDRIVGVNLTSAFHLGAQAAAAMRERGGGRLVFFSSVAGRSGHKLHGPYAATKGAINQLMRVIAHEYAAHGVTANAVAPGYMDTALTRRYLADNPGKREALIELIPAGRFGSLKEVVDPVLFLCSPRASFITGQVLYIDGGRTII
ncbi:MAG TPA: SDR family NAD(P)-dependent oxidoreductase [Solirubrobacteraceae bacterium]|nr:SDR family NAD(P)-dependent oxidoreductase [Solirubrobacteraceae bacterium]